MSLLPHGAAVCSYVLMPDTWPLRPVEQQHLRRLRQAVPMTLRALADAADCSYGHLRRVETTWFEPSPELAQRLAHALSRHGRKVEVHEFYDRPALKPRRPA